MKNLEIEKHEILKQAALFSYDEKKHKIPNGYYLYGTYSHENGFNACIIQKGNDIIIAYRGTDKDDKKDLEVDLKMLFNKIPVQAHQAIAIYDQTRKDFPNAKITVTGHSLGGSLSQIVSAERGVEAVTFNAYGTRNLFSDKTHIKEDKIINYCNPNDGITTLNAKNHIGKCYEINTNGSSTDYHSLENMKPLEYRKISNPESLQGAWHSKQRLQDDYNYYIKTGKNMPIRMPSLHSSSNCAGTYPVKGYTREDGTKVSGYTRTCGAEHKVTYWRGKPFNLHDLSQQELEEWLFEVL